MLAVALVMRASRAVRMIEVRAGIAAMVPQVHGKRLHVWAIPHSGLSAMRLSRLNLPCANLQPKPMARHSPIYWLLGSRAMQRRCRHSRSWEAG